MMDDPFEYLTFGGTFGRSFGLLFDRLDLFMAISFVFLIPYAIMFLTFAWITLSWAFWNEAQKAQILQLGLGLGIEFLLYKFASVLGQGAIAYAVAEIYVGRRPGWRQCLAKGWDRKWSLVGASLLVHVPLVVTIFAPTYGVAVLVDNHFRWYTVLMGLVLVIGFGIVALYAYSGLLLMGPAIMVEQITSPTMSAKRSWELARGSRCYLVCTLLCLALLNQIVTAFSRNVFASLSEEIVGQLLAILPMILFFPVRAIIETVLYLNLRIGRESMNQQVLSGDLLREEPPASRFRSEHDLDFSDDDNTSSDRHYRQIPLMDDTDADEEAVFAQQQPPLLVV